MCEKIIACMKSLAASVERYGRMCLKLDRLNLILLATFFTCFLNVRCESRVIPRYLNSDTIWILLPSMRMSMSGSVELREKNMPTVLVVFRCKQEFLNQSDTWTMAAVSFSAASCLFFACT